MSARKMSSPLRATGTPGVPSPPHGAGTNCSTIPEPPKTLPATSAYTNAVDPVRFAAVFWRSTFLSWTAVASDCFWDHSPKYPSVWWSVGALPRYAETSGPSIVTRAFAVTFVGSKRASVLLFLSDGLKETVMSLRTELPGAMESALRPDRIPGPDSFVMERDATVTGPPKAVNVRDAKESPVADTAELAGSWRISNARWVASVK